MNDKTKTEEELNKVDAKATDELSARLDKMQGEMQDTIESQAKIIEDLKNNPTTAVVEDEAILVGRQSAHSMLLPVVEGAPVIAGKLERVVGIQGLENLMVVKTAGGKTYKFPIGCDISKLDFSDDKLEGVKTTSYENLETKKFKFQNIDENDKTGASKVEKDKIVGEGGNIPEIDRSSGMPMKTGRSIRTVVLRDVRTYTIEHDGKKFHISSEDLGNFRI